MIKVVLDKTMEKITKNLELVASYLCATRTFSWSCPLQAPFLNQAMRIAQADKYAPSGELVNEKPSILCCLRGNQRLEPVTC